MLIAREKHDSDVFNVAPRVCLASAKRIAVGMTRRDVEGVLGRPRDESGGTRIGIYPPNSVHSVEGGDMRWVGRDVAITVRFNLTTGRVSRVWLSCRK